MRLNHASFTGTEGAPALLSVSATNGIGTSLAGAPASVVASVIIPALAGDAGGPAGVAIETAAVPVIMAVTRLSSSRRSPSSFAPRSIKGAVELGSEEANTLAYSAGGLTSGPSRFPANCLFT
eukprot:6134813-Pyramimonas_sp.AAC.1